MVFIDIIKFIGACAAIVGTCYSIANSRRFILRRIDHKESQIRRIDFELAKRYGLNRRVGIPLSDLDIKKNKLNGQINDLKRYL